MKKHRAVVILPPALCDAVHELLDLADDIKVVDGRIKIEGDRLPHVEESAPVPYVHINDVTQ